jgi:hypothetical protein
MKHDDHIDPPLDNPYGGCSQQTLDEAVALSRSQVIAVSLRITFGPLAAP